MLLGSHIGQYKIVKKIGAGGMGHVFLGEHTLLGRRAAIKTLLPTLSVNREIAERFFNEARATSSISDPGVIQIFDFGYHVDGTAYIVMELLEGEALSARIERLGKLPIADALRIARQGAASLSAAHAHKIVHRDLKPENIFLVHDGEAQGGERTKILDFGICKLGGDDVALTESGQMIGTPVYMSPEQCRGADDVDHRSDIYAFGCLMFHMVTGRPPFLGASSADLIVSHLREEPPLASSFTADVPPEVDALLVRCLTKAADERFQSMAELQAAIEEIAAHLPVAVPTVAAPQPTMLLGEGFRSVYDASRGSPVPQGSPAPIRTSAPPARHDFEGRVKFGTPIPSQEDDDDADLRPRRSGLRTFLAITLVASVIGGAFAASVYFGNEDATAGTTPPIAAMPNVANPNLDLPTAPPKIDRTVARTSVEPTSAAVASSSAPAVTESAPAPHDEAPTVLPEPTTPVTNPRVGSDSPSQQMAQQSQTKLPAPAGIATRAAAPTVKKQPVRRQRIVNRKPTPTPASSPPPPEDLYDTR